MACEQREKKTVRSSQPNLRAARALTRSVAEPDAATTCILVLAETLAGQLDAGVAGAHPAYVLSKVAATYCNTLQLLSGLVSPNPEGWFEQFIRESSVPRRTGASDEPPRWE
jgi:hypothetical protein